MKVSSLVLGALCALCADVAQAQTLGTGIGTDAPDADKALHVKAAPGQEPLRLEGLQPGTTEEDVLVRDADDVVRYRPITDLIQEGEWRDAASSNYIYALRALNEGGANVVVTDAGQIGLGTTTPQGGMQMRTGGLVVNAAPVSGTYDARESIRMTGGTSDALVAIQDGTGRWSFKWNATYGNGERFLSNGDNAVKMQLHGDAAPGTYAFRILQSDAGGVAGDPITWTNLFNVSNEGNVGIGDVGAPTARLDVNGTARVRDLPNGVVLGAPNLIDDIVTADPNGNLRQVPVGDLFNDVGEWVNANNNLHIYARRAKDDQNQDVAVTHTGRLGIGTTTPTARLDVRGGSIQVYDPSQGIGFNRESGAPGPSTRQAGRIYSSPNAFDGRDALVIEKTDDDNPDPNGGIVIGNRGDDNVFEVGIAVEGDGDVGIGTDEPLRKLHVEGDALVRRGGGNGLEDGSEGLINVVDVSTSVPFATRGLQVADETDYVYFGLRDRGNDREDGVIVWGDNGEEDFGFAHSLSGTVRDVLHLDGGTLGVGIGTTAPENGFRLHVDGRARVEDLPAGTLNGTASDDQVVTADAQGRLNKVPASSLFQSYEDLDWTIAGNNIYNANPGNVGIGVTNPQYRLDIGNGNANLRNDVRLIIGQEPDNYVVGAGANDVLWRTNRYLTFLNDAEDRDLLAINGTDAANVTPAVGIGTRYTTGSYGLDVATEARFRVNRRLYFGDEDRVGTSRNRNYVYSAGAGNLRFVGNQRVAVRDRDDALDVFTVRTDQDRVGVLTTDPSVAFDVNGRTRLRDLPAGATADLLVSTDVNGNLRSVPRETFEGPWVRDDGNGEVYQRNLTDQVGIGLDDPRGTLHIYEAVGTAAAPRDGSLILEHGNAGGESSIVFQSAQNEGSDFGYLRYYDDNPDLTTGNAEQSLLEIGVLNDGTPANRDDIAIMPSVGLGVNTRVPSRTLDVNGQARIRDLPDNTTDLFAVTADGNGNLNRQPITAIKDNLGNHEMTEDLATNGFGISHGGTPDDGLVITPLNSGMISGRFQVGSTRDIWIDDVITGITDDGFAGNDAAVFAPVYTGVENSDLRLYITDNPQDAFSIWGNPCSSNCGDINASTQVARFEGGGRIRFNALGGSGTRMVVANAAGVLSTQAIPTGGGGGTADNLGNHTATQDLRLNGRWVRFNGSANNRAFRVLADGAVDMENGRRITWGNRFNNRLQNNNNDMELRAGETLLLRARNNDVEVRAGDQIRLRAEGNGGNDDIRFLTRNTERVRIQNDGDLQVFDLAGAGNRVVRADATGTLFADNTSTDGLWERDPANAETFLANATDQVGIGIADPAAALHLQQASPGGLTAPMEVRLSNRSNNGATSLFFMEGNSENAGIRLTYDGQRNALDITEGGGLLNDAENDADPTRYLTVERATGSVGIGTSDPDNAARLHVNRIGGAGLSDPAEVRIQNQADQGSAQLRFREGTGNVNANSMLLRYNSSADGSGNAMEITSGNGTARLRVERDNGQVTASNLATGAGNPDEMVVADQNGVLSTRAFDTALWDRTGNATHFAAANSADQLGVGTTAPTARLDVDGGVRVRSLPTTTDPNLDVVVRDAAGNLLTRDIGAFAQLWRRDPAGYLGVANTGDRVGIGVTPAAGHLLHVGSGEVRFDDLATGSLGTTLVTADADGTLGTTDASAYVSYWQRDATNGYVAPVDLADQVGIGVASPQAALHVVGDLRFADLANATDGEMVMADADGDLYTQAIAPQLWNRAGTTTALANTGDNVGIGTLAPAATLDVAGNVRFNTTAGTSADNILVQDASGEIKSVDPGTFESHWTYDPVAQELYPKDLDANVGIGTDDPFSRLEVVDDGGVGLVDPVELRIQNTTNGGSAQIRFRDNASTGTNADFFNSMVLRYNGDLNVFDIAGGTDSTYFRMRRQNGNIALFTPNQPTFVPQDRLHIDGNLRFEDGHRVQFAEANSYLRDNGTGGGGDGDVVLRAADQLYLRGGGNQGIRVNNNGTLVFEDVPTVGAATDVLVINGTNVRRTSAANLDDQTLAWSAATGVLSIDDGNAVDLSTSPAIDDQQVSYDAATGVLALTDGGSVDLSNAARLDDQGLAFDAATSVLSIDNGIAADLSALVDTDDQALVFDPVAEVLTVEDGAGSVDLSVYRDNTDAQDLTQVAGVLTLTGDASPVDLTAVAQIDDQQLSIAGSVISLTNGGSVALPPATVDTDDQALLFDPVAEVLTVEDGAGSVDLSVYRDNTDAQALSYDAGTGLLRIANVAGGIDLADVLRDEVAIDDQQLTYDAVATTLTLQRGGVPINLGGLADDLGDHTATQHLALNGQFLSNDGQAEGLSIGNAGEGRFSAGLTVDGLAGAGTEMVVADAAGLLARQPIPVDTDAQGLTFDAATGTLTLERGGAPVVLTSLRDDLGNHTATQNVALNGQFLSNDGQAEGLSIGNAGEGRFSAGLTVEGLVGTGDAVVVADATGTLRRENPSTFADDLGNHTATTNLRLGGNYLSGDGDAEGILVNAAGGVTMAELPSGNYSAPFLQDVVMLNTTGALTKVNKAQFMPSGVPSDRRLKYDVTPLDGVLEGLESLRPATYRYTAEAVDRGLAADTSEHYGFMAQDLAAAFPHAVTERDGYLQLENRELVGLLFAAVKELAAGSDSLVAANAALLARVSDLEAEKNDLHRDVDALRDQTAELTASMSDVLEYVRTARTATAADE